MLNVITMPLGDYQTNCYIVSQPDSRDCVVIDPGYFGNKILDRLEQERLTCCAILLTHGHFDHVGAVRDLAADTDCPIYLCGDDLALPPDFTAGPLCYTDLYGDGQTLEIADMTFQVIHTPGHTPGSVCLLCEDVLFSGDTLFAGSCGRTDLPLGNWADMVHSLGRLRDIPFDLTVYPGHGPSTSLERERRQNPYMKGSL